VTPPPEIRLADRYDAEAVAELIAVAFGPLAVARWLIDDDHSRARLFPGHFRIFVDHALTHGVIHTTTDRRAAALWLPATAPPPADYQARLAATCGPYLGRFQALDAAFVAVHPARQDTGLGSALLAHHHRQLDAEGTPAYLEASSPRSRQLYLRHGYHDLPDAPFYLPEDGPPMWPMWRPPGQAAGGRP
jgi:GNAT superfamily N-acetyltransferase